MHVLTINQRHYFIPSLVLFSLFFKGYGCTHMPETYKNTHSSNLLLFAAADSVITLNINREPRAKTWKIGGGWGGEEV